MIAAEEEKKEQVRAIFSSVSCKYDLLNSLLSLLLDRCWRWRTARLLREFPSGPVLDLCAGTLPLSLELARQAKDRSVLAVDFCEGMLRAGVKSLPDDRRTARIFPVCGDGEEIPAPSNAFWGCTVGFGVRNLAEPRKGLKEMHRVLRPGGKLLILELSRPANRCVKPIYYCYLHYMLPRIASLCAGHRQAYEYLAKSIASFYEPEELLAMLRETGFSGVERRQLSLGIVSIYIGIKQECGDRCTQLGNKRTGGEDMATPNSFDSKSDRPWPNQYLDLAAIVGHTTASTCRLWLRTGRPGNFMLLYCPISSGGANALADSLSQAGFDPARLPAEVTQRTITVSADKDATVVADLAGLRPGTIYQYALAEINPPKVILGQDRAYQFRTFPAQDSIFSFAFYSCHMPYKDSLFGASGTPQVANIEMWEYLYEMLKRHQEKQQLRFVIAGGDQVYADGADSLNIWSYLNKKMRKENGKLLPDEPAMRSWYRDIYRGYWGFPQVRKVFSSFPMYMIWDDHEIMDGWGSRWLKGEGKDNDEIERIFAEYKQKGLTYDDCRTLLTRMEAAAKAVYEEYQHGHNPTTAAGIYDYDFRHDRSAFYILDGRGCRDINRDSHRILGKPQLERFKQWADALDSTSTRLLFVVLTVPMLHMTPAVVNADDNFLARMEGLEDDLRDAWEHNLHDEERKELLAILFAAANRGIGVCILSGDVHTAAAFRMKDKKTGAVMYQLTSSAITYNVPRTLGWVLGGLVSDEGTSDDGYDYERLARYTDSNFVLIRADQDKQKVTFQIYGRQEVEHPVEEAVLPMTNSLAKLELDFSSASGHR